MIVRSIKKSVDNLSNAGIGAVQRVRAQLEQMILAGELEPGDRLNELSLAARFDIGRAHLREAVRALEEAHLIEVIANRGALVRKLDLPEALELFDIRAGLARSAGRLAVLRGTRARIKEIQEAHRHMGAAAARGDLSRFQELNLRFHGLLFDAAGNARLRDMDLTVRNEMQLYIRENVRSEAQLKVSCEEHAAIVSGLVSADAEACATAFENHILNGKRRLMDRGPLTR